MDTDTQREELTRISVDTLHDWERVKASYTAAALAELDQRVAGRSTKDKDALKAHLLNFVEKTFEMTKPNLRVNGRNFEDLDNEEQEPFDEGFDRHIWSLSDQRLKWDGEIAKRRRTTPGDVSGLMQDLLERQRELEKMEAAEVEVGDVVMDDADADVPEETYINAENVVRRTIAISEELQQCISLQHERSERLKTVGAEIKALKP